jgi:CRP-like cAMP-binding protein
MTHLLGQTGWIAHCAPEFRAFVLAHLSELEVAPWGALTHAGDEDGGIYGLIEGQAAFVTTIGSPTTGLTHFGFPGSWWGQAPLLGVPRMGFATARTLCRVGVVPLRPLRAHLSANPLHWRDIALGYTDLFQAATGAHADAIIPDHSRRLAATLLRLGGRRHRRYPIVAPAEYLCTQEELAGALGLARNTAGRLLRALVATGLVRAAYGRVTLLDVPGLEALADGA